MFTQCIILYENLNQAEFEYYEYHVYCVFWWLCVFGGIKRGLESGVLGDWNVWTWDDFAPYGFLLLETKNVP